eukprot:1021698-Pleurochrysis_carterae.AAC.2
MQENKENNEILSLGSTAAKSRHRLTINGRNKIFNANYYGSIEEDATHFIWKSKPIFNKDTIGSKGRTGKLINTAATCIPFTRGGAGCLNWKAHPKAFQAYWAVSLLHPREALWKKIFSHWADPMPKEYIVHLTTQEKRQLKNRIPKGASYN